MVVPRLNLASLVRPSPKTLYSTTCRLEARSADHHRSRSRAHSLSVYRYLTASPPRCQLLQTAVRCAASFLYHAQAEAMMASRSVHFASKPSTRLAALASATSFGGSPGRRPT